METWHWNTAVAPKGESFDIYRDGLCATFSHLSPCLPDHAPDFAADLKSWAVGDSRAAILSASPHQVARSRTDIAAAADEFFYVNYVIDGQMRISQGDSRWITRTGGFFVLDNSRPFVADFCPAHGKNRHMAIRLKNSDAARAKGFRPEDLARHPNARLLSRQLNLVALACNEASVDLFSLALVALDELLDLSILGSSERAFGAESARTLAATKDHIASNFRDPDYGLAQATRALKIAPRTLQLHLSAYGASFSALLRAQRLRAAGEELRSAPRTESVEAIAYRNGFQNLSSFYRTYKAAFRTAPGQSRLQ
jgi:AraC-like DNA-binding protein